MANSVFRQPQAQNTRFYSVVELKPAITRCERSSGSL
jgi:hypothetical protein